MAQTISGRSWELSVDQQMIDVTCGVPTLDPKWRGADSNGHEHYYDNGYVTLDLIIDAQHWCNGDEGIARHDPHMQIDESHYVCKVCGETVKPGELPAYTPQFIPGQVNAQLTGFRSDGVKITAWLTSEELDLLTRAQRATGVTEAGITALLDSIPEDRIRSATFASR